MRGIWGVLVLALMLISASIVEAAIYLDTDIAGWDAGWYIINTTSEDNNLTLDKNLTGQYYKWGGFISQTINPLEVVSFSKINWTENINALEHTVVFSARFRNGTNAWSSWISPLTNNGGFSEYAEQAQYLVNFTTSNTSTTPRILDVTVEYNTLQPNILSYEPSEGSSFAPGSNVTFNCTAGSPNNLTSITFYWNYSGTFIANGTDARTNEINTSSFSRLNNSIGTYIWNCLALDSEGYTAWMSTNRTIVFEIALIDATNPTLTHTLSPVYAIKDTKITIIPTAADDVNLSTVWAVIDHPGVGTDTIIMNRTGASYYNASRSGRHNITIFANDTSGNEVNNTNIFYAYPLFGFSSSVEDNNGTGIDSDMDFYAPGTNTQVRSFSSSTGAYSNLAMPNGTYDIVFRAFNNGLRITIDDVKIWQNAGKIVSMDKLPIPVSGYAVTYAVETTFPFSAVTIRIDYDTSDYLDESHIKLFICNDWNITSRQCDGTWNESTASPNTNSNYIETGLTSLSAFSLKEEGFCGDFVCSGSENATSCPEDCTCNTGQTRPCSQNFDGRCGAGIETCTSGLWSGCQQPINETCNKIDDDCDGIVDNINGGNSIQATSCGCYNNAPRTDEINDSIDNDCNGQIDDGCECALGETRPCGSTQGECSPGVYNCIGCQWGDICVGSIGPFAEICGNGLDDDCDSDIDEAQCTTQGNTTCSEGEIPSSGCRCGNGVYTSGFCCGGERGFEACPGFPFWILIVVGVVVLAAAAIYYFFLEGKKKGNENEWDSLEKKYTPAKM